jgi:hypothetical protein
MKAFIPIFCSLLLLMSFCSNHLYGQIMPLQTFSLASDHFVQLQEDGIQIDWRLDLGVTAIQLEQSNAYLFSAGFLQPTIGRFKIDAWDKYNPSFELKYNLNGAAIVLVSKEPDIILCGYKIFDLSGREIINHQAKYMSSFLAKSIDINTMSSGVYIMQILYFPEFMSLDSRTPYWTKYVKFIKP